MALLLDHRIIGQLPSSDTVVDFFHPSPILYPLVPTAHLLPIRNVLLFPLDLHRQTVLTFRSQIPHDP